MDNISELAELFVKRDNPKGYCPYIGEHVGGGIIKIKENVLLRQYKSCVANVENYDKGTQFLVLPMEKSFVVVGRVYG